MNGADRPEKGRPTGVGTLPKGTPRVRQDGASEHQAAQWVPAYEASRRNAVDAWPPGVVDQQITARPDPTVGARPGDLLASGPGTRWVAYQTEGVMVAACYLRGRLLRWDRRGWWVVDATGGRVPVPDRDVAPLVGSGPPDWPVPAEQARLLDEQAEVAEVRAAGRPLKWIA